MEIKRGSQNDMRERERKREQETARERKRERERERERQTDTQTKTVREGEMVRKRGARTDLTRVNERVNLTKQKKNVCFSLFLPLSKSTQ